MPRKKPFSSKQKKAQLLRKREKKRREDDTNEAKDTISDEEESTSGDESHGNQLEPIPVDKVHHQPVKDGSYDPNRYRLHFERESREEIEKRKLLAKRKIIRPVDSLSMEMGVDDVYKPGSVLDIPKRPAWHYGMSKAEVEGQEEAMFERYLKDIYSSHKPEELSYFEHNLETWRQLWRVLEISDVVLFITDVRHPALHFSPALYDYVVKDLKKQLVLVLNKVDLVPPQAVVAWRHYFLSKFPQLNVICFTCYPNKELSTQPTKKVRLKFRRAHPGKLPSAVGPRELFTVISEMYQGKVDICGWRDKFQMTPDNDAAAASAPTGEDEDSHSSSDTESEEVEEITMTTMSSNPLEKDGVETGVLTIGMVGHPNVGKSSIINGLQGRKVVSTSRTPGHTKHFQTIFLTRSLRLCDCPGLVFPSLVSRQLQVLSGVYPIAQVREPYTAVGFVSQRIPLIVLLALKHPLSVATVAKKTKGKKTGDFEIEGSAAVADLADPRHVTKEDYNWTAWDVCDAWAESRGYYTARGARLDTYRAANSLLRLVVDGRICLYFVPPGYSKEKAFWEGHPEVKEMITLQQEGMAAPSTAPSSKADVPSIELDTPIENKFAALMHIDDDS